ncbi:Phosphatidylinositol transfer protein [Histomonas meleagridis]|uniref:Phosphatidylinositol transfer protein n=1 Tax=Histomonas meleagridis TaxID=135588 RepID=UPI00355AC417|nr:Phosphatidylinositol transfer protein [Histomonas meleagridis]KAH0796651.1 Phosphatidylinositol transfer protein [Histomonas meleagridis]
MKIIEFRIIVPLSVEKYGIGFRYMGYLYAKDEKKNGEGIELVKTEPFENENEKGNFTYKIYHCKSKIPRVICWAVPEKFLHFHEKSFNAFPHIKTTNFIPDADDKFFLQVESQHIPYTKGMEIPDNVLNLNEEELAMRTVVYLDILDGKPDPDKPEYDLHNFFCPEVNINTPLKNTENSEFDQNGLPSWVDSFEGEMMICVKVLKFEFHWFGLQSMIENIVGNSFYPGTFTNTNRKVVASAKDWHNLTTEQMNEIENKLMEDQYKDGGFITDE